MDMLYKQHARKVYKYLFSLCHNEDLAEELTQETFYRALYSINTYNGSCTIYVWLCQIAKHIWYQEIEKRKKTTTEPLYEEIQSAEASPENKLVLAQNKLELFRALHSLDEPMREVMYLRLTGEFSFREIGEILHKDETWARVTFYRGKQKIMKG
jgi:RNA polymerase sigma-70 factor (ECF subfamily)